jgi:glucokinase
MSTANTPLAARGGIDLGGTKIEAVIVDARNKVLGQSRRPTPTAGGPEDVAQQLIGAMREAAGGAKLDTQELLGIGVGSPGVVDSETGSVSSARNLPGWDGHYALGSALTSELGTPVFVGNDVQVATDAEFKLGAGKPYKSVLGVFWGTGVGGGLVLNGKPWTGRGGAGEIGHVVVNVGGARCPCGRRGCMEAYAGRAAMEARARKHLKEGKKTDLFKLMKQHGRTRLTSAVWEHALHRGDKLTVRLIDDAVTALGAGVASAVNLLDVEAVIIGGGLGLRLGVPFVEPPQMHLAALGDLGGAIGAALLVKRSNSRVNVA